MKPLTANPTVAIVVFCLSISALGAVEAQDKPARSPGQFEGSKAGEARTDNAARMTFVWCPPGTFRMGSPKNEKGRRDDEGPVDVSLTQGFWLGQHEVTQAEWQRVMKTSPWHAKSYVTEGDTYPATYVSWSEAMKFCEQLSQQERIARRLPSRWQYALPTEAEWEYACRAGTKSRFSFGDNESDMAEYAWFDKNAWEMSEEPAHAVAQKKANPWGLDDMHGNVWEWCRDWYAAELRGGADPSGPSEGLERVARGGSWFIPAGLCRSALRMRFDPSSRSYVVGFRVAIVRSDK